MNYTFTFTPQQLSVINAALQELPFKVAAPLFEDLNKQIREQEKDKRESPEQAA